MTRQEHLAWCKKRAIEEMDYSGNPHDAIISMLSDIRKHPETASSTLSMLAMGMMAAGKLNTRQEVIDFINGFN